ncbi:MAG: polysaccharide deacetylase family protein [Actinomyces sp.]|uniref:polysaccharide deacetylase family protein n=1 Tax=Actinomyces sp. TaxID=29317 RepID=UPI0026DC52E1|nr:polysaccharide deacetylase family protein [Actinomyces sp.]MDO4243338.1 polysaccharide deacetylase family protein [Actinomyces sp.]
MTDGATPLAGASSQILFAPAYGSSPYRRRTVISDMQDAGAWVKSSTGGSMRAATTTFARGTQSLELTTTGDPAQPTAIDLALGGVDMSQCQWDLMLRAEDHQKIDGIWLEVGQDDSSYLRLDVTPDPRTLRTGGWSRVTVNRASTRSVTGRPALTGVTRVRVRVNPKSGAGPTRVWLGYLGLLPAEDSGVVSISFDDGYDTDYTTARVIMQRHGIPTGTSYVIADKIGLPGRMTLDQLKELRDVHNWEIAAHATTDLTTLDEAGLRGEFERIKSFLIDNGHHDSAHHFALPMGRYNELVLQVAQQYFSSVRTIDVAHETVVPGDPMRLRVFYTGRYTTEAQVSRALALCAEHHSWTHIVFHRVQAVPDGAPETVDAATFEAFMRQVAASGLPVKKVAQIVHGV